MPFLISHLTPYFKGQEDPLSPLTKEGAIVPGDKPKENEPFFRSHKEIVLITCLLGMSSLAINYAPRLVSFASLAALALSQAGIYSTLGLGGLGALALGYVGLHNSSLGSFLTAAVENVKSHSATANKAQSDGAAGEGKGVEAQIIGPAQEILGKPAQDLLNKTLPVVTNKVQDLVTGLITPKVTPPSANTAPVTPKPIKKPVDPASTVQPESAIYQAGVATQPQKKRVTIEEPKEKQPKKELINSLIEKSKKVELTAEELKKFEFIYQAATPRTDVSAPKQKIEKASKKEPKEDKLTVKELKKFETAYQTTAGVRPLAAAPAPRQTGERASQKDRLTVKEMKKFETTYKQSHPTVTRAPQRPRATNPEMPIYSQPVYGAPQTEEIRKVTNRLAHLHNHLLGIQPPLSVLPSPLFSSKIPSRL